MELFETLEVALGGPGLGFALAQLAFHLGEPEAVGGRVDLGEQLAGDDLLALGEGDLE